MDTFKGPRQYNNMQNSVAVLCMRESRINSQQTASDKSFSEWCSHPSYPLLPVTPTISSLSSEFRMMGFFGKVCVGVEEAESYEQTSERGREGGEIAGLNLHRLTAD